MLWKGVWSAAPQSEAWLTLAGMWEKPGHASGAGGWNPGAGPDRLPQEVPDQR